MSNTPFARRVALIAALTVVAPVVAQRTDPPPPLQIGRQLFRTIVTPVLSGDLTHGGQWNCTALNVTDDPLSVTVRAFNTFGQEVPFDDHTCTIDPGRVCTQFWQTGLAGHYCTFTFRGAASSVRAGLQVTDDDGYSLFAEAH